MSGQPPQEWRAPGKKQIEKACANERQVVLALAGGEIIFFELDEAMQNIQARAATIGITPCLGISVEIYHDDPVLAIGT